MYDTLINITYIICFFLPIKIYSITISPLFTCLRELSLWTTPLHASHPTRHPEKAMPLCSSSTRDHCKSLSLLCNASHTTSAYTALCDSVMWIPSSLDSMSIEPLGHETFNKLFFLQIDRNAFGKCFAISTDFSENPQVWLSSVRRMGGGVTIKTLTFGWNDWAIFPKSQQLWATSHAMV